MKNGMLVEVEMAQKPYIRRLMLDEDKLQKSVSFLLKLLDRVSDRKEARLIKKQIRATRKLQKAMNARIDYGALRKV